MEALRIHAQADEEGVLVVRDPRIHKGETAEIIVLLPKVTPTAWPEEFVQATVGAWVGDPPEEPQDLPFEKREEWS